ncbi:hypothetical protein F3Y22_tig00015919pilonHSYRG00043 [Hibiscus syriacus]|uniref:Barwin domain-containing protein n=1 Tax=Hibiscus syriacus TaxID=106335 RepID=A0A6A3BX93_HIBSY|nr:hypothetical protein F3Y22_tig00015919pilonHSYRG00043 [Hibiscus syriacus]
MDRSVMSLSSLLVLACLVGYGTAQSVQNVSAHWVDFFAKENDWDMNKANDVYCKIYDADKPYEWRSKYNWTHFGDVAGLSIDEACGKCIHVSNAFNNLVTPISIEKERKKEAHIHQVFITDAGHK